MLSLFVTDLSLPLKYLLLAFAAGYFSGSVPYGLVLTKLAGLGDIRKVGSGNIGATNVLRAAGKKIAALTLVLDALKGALPVALLLNVHQDYAVLAGLGAFLGHCFPVWLKFKGGKGVATALGVCYGFSFVLGGVLCGVWMIVAALSQYSSAAGLAIFAIAPMLSFYLLQKIEITLVIFIISVIVWVRHHQNLKRLLNGTESKIEFSKKDKTS